MPPVALYIVAVITAYLLGSVPFGLIVVKLVSGRDIREVGSGRTGGTNALRAAGLAAGLLTAFFDILKGFLSVYMARILTQGQAPGLEALCAVAAVAGHNWPIFLKFKGGAGTGPNVGAAIALWPWSGLIIIPLTALILYLLGYASVASTSAGIIIVAIFVARYLFLSTPIAYIGYGLATLVLTAIALIPNYQRLVAGTERIVGRRARTKPTSEQPG
jgi:glycerol-3-phosphate acyltransferase PlsY